MTFLGRKSGSQSEADDLQEWARHHDDPRSGAAFEIFTKATMNPDLTESELRTLWQQANHLIGQRAPADYAEFILYGYIEGRRDALRSASRTGSKGAARG
jgi:hypothetical protein